MIGKQKLIKIVQDRYNYHLTGSDEYLWADRVWRELKSWDDHVELLIAIIENTPIDDLDYLGSIGAGLLSYLYNEGILQFIKELRNRNINRHSEFDKKLCIALQMYMFPISGSKNDEEELLDYIKFHYPSFVEDGEFHLQ